MVGETADIELARRLEQSISLSPLPPARGADVVECGPFRAWFMSDTAAHQLNYAMPVAAADAQALLAAIDRLRALFVARGRMLRVEFVEELWPALAPALRGAGLHLDTREPLMACAKAEFSPVVAPAVAVRALVSEDHDDQFAEFVRIRDAHPVAASRAVLAKAMAGVRDSLRGGLQICALATIDGRAAAVGRCILQPDGLGEITSIVTAPEARRRGAAATLVSFLLRRLFETDRSIAWLNAANDGARALYAGLGFCGIAHVVSYEDDRG